MKFSAAQQDAIIKFSEWYRKDKSSRIFTIAGYAGTGKTTIAKEMASIAANCHADYLWPQFCTYTGKAASVLRDKGCEGATTIHSLFYTSAGKSRQRLQQLREEYTFIKNKLKEKEITSIQFHTEEERIGKRMEAEKKNCNQPNFHPDLTSEVKDNNLIIVDEYSMLDPVIVEDMIDVLMSEEDPDYMTKILFLGDPGQLPPVAKKQYDFQPDVFLTDIHRQALDSPILRAATKARMGESINLGEDGDFKCVERKDLGWDDYSAADQMLVGMNKTAKGFNYKFREKYEYDSPLPVAGEKVMCFKNNHSEGLLNGVTYKSINDCKMHGDWHEACILSIKSEDEDLEYIDLECWSPKFDNIIKEPEPEQRDYLNMFDYRYAITVHKSQGSEWDDVIVYDDYLFTENKEFRKRWLYTAITRASKTCTLVRS